MKYKAIALGIVAILILAGGLIAVQGGNDNNGNGAPSGHHYTLNLLGKNWEKDESVMDNNGHRIFVGLGNNEEKVNTRILLQMGDFNVIDADGTDGTATFQLPDPNTVIVDDEFVSADYYVYIRVLGKPEGWAEMYSGFTDGDGTWVSLEKITLGQEGKQVNRKSPPKFVDVTKELTTIYVDMDLNGVPERYGLFDNELWSYFWEFDNNGLRHVQLRFYDRLPVEA